MDISLDTQGKWIVIHVRGRVDSFNHEFLASKLATLKRAGKKFIAVDLSDVNYVGLSIANLISKYEESLRAEGGGLAVISSEEKTVAILRALSQETLEIHGKTAALDRAS